MEVKTSWGIQTLVKPPMSYQQEVIGASFYWRTLYMFFDVNFPREDAHDTLSQETHPLLTNKKKQTKKQRQ